jgi:hypothetical protein
MVAQALETSQLITRANGLGKRQFRRSRASDEALTFSVAAKMADLQFAQATKVVATVISGAIGPGMPEDRAALEEAIPANLLRSRHRADKHGRSPRAQKVARSVSDDRFCAAIMQLQMVLFNNFADDDTTSVSRRPIGFA